MKSLSIGGPSCRNCTFAQLKFLRGNDMTAPVHKIVDPRSKSTQIMYTKLPTPTSCCFVSQCTAIVKLEHWNNRCIIAKSKRKGNYVCVERIPSLSAKRGLPPKQSFNLSTSEGNLFPLSIVCNQAMLLAFYHIIPSSAVRSNSCQTLYYQLRNRTYPPCIAYKYPARPRNQLQAGLYRSIVGLDVPAWKGKIAKNAKIISKAGQWPSIRKIWT